MQTTTLWSIGSDGEKSVLFSQTGDGRHVNAIGFHKDEGYIYGIAQTDYGPANLIRIARDGSYNWV